MFLLSQQFAISLSKFMFYLFLSQVGIILLFPQHLQQLHILITRQLQKFIIYVFHLHQIRQEMLLTVSQAFSIMCTLLLAFSYEGLDGGDVIGTELCCCADGCCWQRLFCFVFSTLAFVGYFLLLGQLLLYLLFSVFQLLSVGLIILGWLLFWRFFVAKNVLFEDAAHVEIQLLYLQ